MGIGVKEENEETFLAKIGRGWRVTIPESVREWMGLKEGSIIRVRIVEQDDSG